MEAWLILIGILVLTILGISTYVSRQLGDKDKDKIQSQGIFPGSTQSSIPQKRHTQKHSEHQVPDRSQPIRRNKAPEVESASRSRKSPGIFRDKNDIKRAFILHELLKRKE